ncbi:MAG: hypothetical protein ACRDQ5_08030, partial [Sciscionella sp.]
MSAWPPWPLDQPALLTRYVQTGVVRALLPAELARRLPGPGAGSRLERVRSLYEVLAARKVRYVREPSMSRAGQQDIRPPDQVLARPGEGSCVDLALTFAGMCLDAGLHPLIAQLGSTRPGDAGHALVIVWLGGDWQARPAADYPLRGASLATAPRDLLDDLRAVEDEPGAFLAVDVT